MKRSLKVFGMVSFLTLLLVPIYWMVNTSLKTTLDIEAEFQWYPEKPTVSNYSYIVRSPEWLKAIRHTLAYSLLNVAIVLAAAVPAAYAFSRFDFRGRKHLFFWMLAFRMAPAVVFIVPIFTLFSIARLFDTIAGVALSHCLFNIPISIWILEGFMRGIPREIDETAFIDGYSFLRFFTRVFAPLLKRGIAVTSFFTFMFSWVELILARTLTSANTKPITVVMSGKTCCVSWSPGVICAAGLLMMVPGGLLVYFMRNHLVTGFAMGRVH
jgi:glycerol transport system permease protein